MNTPNEYPASSLQGSATCHLLLTIDVLTASGESLSLYRREGSAPPSPQPLAGGQPLLAAALILVSDVLATSATQHGFIGPVALHALDTFQRLLLSLVGSGLRLAKLPWDRLGQALLELCGFISKETRTVVETRLPLALLLTTELFLTVGDSLFTNARDLEAWAHSLVARRAAFDRLVRAAPSTLTPLCTLTPLTTQVLMQLSSAADSRGGGNRPPDVEVNLADTTRIVRRAQRELLATANPVPPKPPCSAAPRDKDTLVQQVLRAQFARARADRTLAPIHFETLIGMHGASGNGSG